MPSCGTGNITERLAALGYDMIGIDNSPEMLDIAQQKKASSESSSLYLCQDMREFELYGTVRAVVSLCDSVNYITDEDDLLTVFKLANNYLDPEGLFIFDFNTLHYYRDTVGESTIAEDREDISFIWDNFFDEDTELNELSLSLFVREEEDSDLYRRHDELHVQRAYTLPKIKELIEKSGLVFVDAFSAYSNDKPDEDTDRVLVITREHGKAIKD